MSSFVDTISAKYEKYVASHPEIITQVESTIRVLSYLIPARFDDSTVLSELVYSASNLLVLLNDALLRKAANVKLRIPVNCEKLANWLSVLECVEVFLEIVAARIWTPTFRWVVITCIVIAKTAIRLVLLWKHKSGIQASPVVPPLNREKDIKPRSDADQTDLKLFRDDDPDAVTFTLKRSGRTVRTLNAAPPLLQRSWKPPVAAGASQPAASHVGPPTRLNQQQMTAETLHIVRPIAHLLTMYGFGQNSWKPWLLSAGMDLASLQMMGEPRRLNVEERREMKRRTVHMLLYLMRSPFYDVYTKAKLVGLLQGITNNVPLVRLISKPIMEYLPYWQQVYFYVWNS